MRAAAILLLALVLATAAAAARSVGTPRNDRLVGTAKADTILGLAGRDRIAGGPGADFLVPGPGRDTVVAGARGVEAQSTVTFRPAAHGAEGARIRLGAGADRAFVLNGLRDVVACGAGRDRVVGDRFDAVARDCELVARAPRVFGGGGRG